MTNRDGLLSKIDIGRYHLAYRWRDAGQPTVVLEAGAVATHESWTPVFDTIAEFATVVSYDRASLGQSDRAPRPRTCQNMVDDLHDLLSAVGIPGLYVLVGHSFGGQIVRLYAHQHRRDVIGMVLVDAMHHDQDAWTLALMPLATPDESPTLTSMRAHLSRGYIDDLAIDSQGVDLVRSNAQVRATGSLGDLPLVVITSCQRGDPPPDWPTGFVAAYNQMFDELQRDLVKLSTRSMHVMAKHSGHFVQADEPELVVAAIRQVIKQAQV